MTALAFGVLGLIVGSFINVVVLRSGARPISGRSACMSCGKKIRWFDLIPVFSWLWLHGRCRACGSRISIQYPVVEFLTGFVFALVGGATLSPLATATGLLIGAVLVAIAAYDILHTIIPDAWVYTFAALALFSALAFQLQATGSLFVQEQSDWLQTAVPLGGYWLPALLSGPAVALPLFALWLVSGGKWIGLGDSKLALGIGWLLGLYSGIAALFLAFIIGAIVGLLLIFFSSDLWRNVISRFIQPYFSKWGQVSLRSTAGFTPTLTLASLLSVFNFRENGGAVPPTKTHRPSTVLQQKTMPKLVYGFTMKSEVPFGPFLIAACAFQWISQMYNISIPFLWQ